MNVVCNVCGFDCGWDHCSLWTRHGVTWARHTEGGPQYRETDYLWPPTGPPMVSVIPGYRGWLVRRREVAEDDFYPPVFAEFDDALRFAADFVHEQEQA